MELLKLKLVLVNTVWAGLFVYTILKVAGLRRQVQALQRELRKLHARLSALDER